jgi:hypothetical protein
MEATLNRDELVKKLIKAGELEVFGGEQSEVDAYFDVENFKFHGPDSFEADYAGLTNYFKSIRAAFDNRSIRRGIIVSEGNTIACQTWIKGTFAKEFTQSPAGPIKPNGQVVVFDLINIFRFNDQDNLLKNGYRPTTEVSFACLEIQANENNKIILSLNEFGADYRRE